MEEEEISQSMLQNNVQKIVDVLQLLDSSPLLKDLYLDVSGFEIANFNGQNKLIRVRKPKWSDDFSYELITIIRRHSNVISAQTDIDKREIKTYMHHRMKELNKLIHYTGRSHFITMKIWEKIQKHWKESHKDTYADFRRSAYISESLVTKFRDPKDLGDFTVYARNLILDMNLIMTLSLYRSKDGLTLQHHQNTQTIREIHKAPEKKKHLLQRMSRRGNDYEQLS